MFSDQIWSSIFFHCLEKIIEGRRMIQVIIIETLHYEGLWIACLLNCADKQLIDNQCLPMESISLQLRLP